MIVVVLCTANQQDEILKKQTVDGVQFIFTSSANEFETSTGDVFFNLLFDEINPTFYKSNQLVFVNAVSTTCAQLPENCMRINAWNGFIERSTVEIATTTHQLYVDTTMKTLGWKYQLVSDEPGMIAPKIIAMIVNEAYFGLEDGISTKEEIDIAMKLGTNYPFGPFEWSEKIGLGKIYHLLQTLSKQDTRYTPSLLLQQTALNIKS
ncbi:MAG: 3-hydroxyacyl-CoA dehydrogenase family protein [Chitinophagaceae bacterium]|jgi:3-hydroxybutyryl-CoA dehydrogenase|nr:3-hydroxyacyl-CoA dehydrogenase family protein [Chitinophagaceae bacterium]